MTETSLKMMWEGLKEYFGDGFAPGSAPFRNNVHYCDLHPAPKRDANFLYGVEVEEEAMPLFSVLGDTCPPPCTCFEVTKLVEHIDRFIATASDYHEDDYAITSGKNDATIDQVCFYAMRDTLSWWVHWGGGLRPSLDYWKHVYVAFAAVPDDFQLPPRDFLSGQYTLLGHTWADCREGLLREGVPAETVKMAEMALWRQMLTQYLEKVDPSLRSLLVGRTSMMMLYRVQTANTLGCAALLLASKGVDVNGLEDGPLEVASIAHCVFLDISKEAMGILKGEKTETITGNRAQMKREMLWVYTRCMDYLGGQPNADFLRRYASAGMHYVPMMDRYRERMNGHSRFAIPPAMARILLPYVKNPSTLSGVLPIEDTTTDVSIREAVNFLTSANATVVS